MFNFHLSVLGHFFCFSLIPTFQMRLLLNWQERIKLSFPFAFLTVLCSSFCREMLGKGVFIWLSCCISIGIAMTFPCRPGKDFPAGRGKHNEEFCLLKRSCHVSVVLGSCITDIVKIIWFSRAVTIFTWLPFSELTNVSIWVTDRATNQARLAKLCFWPVWDSQKLFCSKPEPILVSHCWMFCGRSEQVLPKQLLIQELLCMDRPESVL